MADKIPTGRTGESIVASPKKSRVTFKDDSMVIYEAGASEYLGDPIHKDPTGRKRVTSRMKKTGGGGGGW